MLRAPSVSPGDQAGDYSIRYVLPDAHLPRSHLLVVPTRGALELVAEQAGAEPEALVYAPDDLEVVREHFKRLNEVTRALLWQYPSMSAEYNDALRLIDEQAGNRYLVLDGLAENTVPREIFLQRAQALQRKRPELARLIEGLIRNHDARASALERMLGTHDFYMVCPTSAIERLVRSGEYAKDDWLALLGGEPETVEQRKLHLRHVAALVTGFERFHLALADPPPSAELFNIYWAVKYADDARSLMLEKWVGDARGRVDTLVELDIEVRHPDVVDAFLAYFQEIWSRLKPEETQPDSVARRIQSAIDQLGA